MSLEIVRASTNNLRGITLSIDPAAITAVCGVSGSGKSSLVFDTIHAESQRRYLETFSPKVREQFAQLARPQAERIDGVPPTIALPQDPGPAAPGTTIGTESDLLDLIAELAAAAGKSFCPTCGQRMIATDAASLASRIEAADEGSRFLIGFPVDGTVSAGWKLLQDARFARAVVGGTALELSDTPPKIGTLDGVADRVVTGRTQRERLLESLQMARRAGRGRVSLFTRNAEGRWLPERFAGGLSCPEGHVACETLTPGDFTRAAAGETDPEASIAAGTQLAGASFLEVLHRPIRDLTAWAGSLDNANDRARPSLVPEIVSRVDALLELSLGDRLLSDAAASLSHGERQRLRLARIVASESVGSLVILDEPSAALAPGEADGVVRAIERLRTQGNGVLLVEHRTESLAIADRVIELGPGAGRGGGEIIFDGRPEGLQAAQTPTAGVLTPPAPPETFDPIGETMTIDWGSETVVVPRDRLTIVTTAAGRGPSRLLADVRTMFEAGHRIEGADAIEDVITLDQSPASRSPRSCLATATKALDEIRALFASVPDAKARGYTARHFSFNAPGGGRCPQCRGQGMVSVAMAHLADLPMDCPRCRGRRYAADVLEVKYRRRSIADALAMTVEEALGFFRTEVSIHRRLQPVKDVGLGYLSLGRSLPSLSGGESQRLKLATHLTASTRGRVLFLLDQPSRGLHPTDAAVLAASLRRLLEIGHTVLAADHSWTLLAAADWIVELEGDHAALQGPPADYQTVETPLAAIWRELCG